MIWQAKGLFGTAALLLVAGTAVLTWRINAALNNAELADLNATIGTLHATIEYQNSRLAALAEKSSSITGVAQARIEVVHTERHDVAGHFGVNVFMKNVGNSAAIGLIHQQQAEILEKPAPPEGIDDVFKTLKAKIARSEAMKITYEIQPNAGQYFTAEFPEYSSDEINEKVTNGPDALLFAVLLEYRDSQILPDQWRVTELCLFSVKAQSDHTCVQHNRIYTFTPEKH